ncbi:TIGR02757 family protein [Dethiosulfovibrio salsuginis]|uniref:TIGR02757 family protein n=1 Tax=Dethiosulfovibrio salsuginis TaxID=561720 RepID=A0A1X7JWS7_9BACT|nr:TIGR02757 family protein [Dethiosulfovibrio salsuginis]SMG32611.1 TIGR02757 family protein [Dethiosulfovibrio salsuginis]
MKDAKSLSLALESIYLSFNKKSLISPDPLQFLLDYPDVEDREIVGMVASSLAYGRVSQILKSVSSVLEPMGNSPRRFLEKGNVKLWRGLFEGFKHRFSDQVDLVDLLSGMKDVIELHGSLDRAMAIALSGDKGTIRGAQGFVEMILKGGSRDRNTLLPRPEGGSACKRLMLYFRWMVRKDQVDPGGWTCLSPEDLLIPLDTHMHRISLAFGFTGRKSGDMRTVEEITGFFRTVRPDDPIRYDFALTRFGIHPDMKIEDLIEISDR